MLIEHSRRFLNSEVPAVPAQQAFFHIIPVPLEATVSYGGGTARGPEAIIAASDQLELLEPLIGDNCYPGEAGIFTHPPVDCSLNGASIHDTDLTRLNCEAEAVQERIAAITRAVLEVGGFPILLGGEHALTYGALKALKERHGVFGVVQFDAHADLRDTFEGTKWSHACVMRRAVEDLGLPLVQFGNRVFCKEELNARATHNVTSWDAPWLARNPLPQNLVPADFPQKIFITFDVDGLDPSIIGDTGTPVPGGLGWYQALDLASNAMQDRTMIGFDIVELAPRLGSIVSDFATARLTYALMGLVLSKIMQD